MNESGETEQAWLGKIIFSVTLIAIVSVFVWFL